jgi:hypothetical protein
LQAANQRHEATKARFRGGDRAALDTLESFIQKETRKQQFQDATLENIKVRLAMVAFKNNQNKSSILNKTIIPEPTAFQKITSVLFSSPEIERQFQQHPEIIWYQTKADILLIEQKWKKEKLKPKLNLEYNFLNKPIENSAYSFSTENYKWGVDFSTPHFLDLLSLRSIHLHLQFHRSRHCYSPGRTEQYEPHEAGSHQYREDLHPNDS